MACASSSRRSILQINSAYWPFFNDAPECDKRIVLLIGGRGSGKSRAVAQKMAVDSCQRVRRAALVRKVRDNIRDSSWKEIQDAVRETTIGPLFTFTSNPLGIRIANGSEFVCKGLDDHEKVKSLAEVEEVWIEELTEIREEEFTTLNLGLRGAGKKRIICTCNPVNSWVKDYFFEADGRTLKRPDEVYCLHTTYLDNKFRGAAFDDAMRRLAERDPLRFQRDGQGLWVQMQGLVYPDFEIVDSWPESCSSWVYGTDFGFNDPHCTVRIGTHEGAIYVDEMIYETGLDSEGVHARFDARIGRESMRKPNFCDNARPEMIEYLSKRGWNVHPCTKGKGSVQDGIAYVRGQRLRITRRSANVLREASGYRFVTDKQGRVLEEPADYDNHAMDAMRYGIIDGISKRGAPPKYAGVEKRGMNIKGAW